MKPVGIFVILLSQDGFECNPETKFQIILRKASSEAAVCRCYLKQVFLKFSQRRFLVNIAKFLRILQKFSEQRFYRKPPVAAFFQFDNVTAQY